MKALLVRIKSQTPVCVTLSLSLRTVALPRNKSNGPYTGSA
jgi:hypothetical protein